MSIKKLLLVTSSYVTNMVASSTDKAQQHISQSWYAKLMIFWEHLGTNIQLAIQLVLVLVAFYALTCFFKCRKSCD